MNPCSHVLRMQFPEAVLREIKILRQLRFHVKKPHPNIIMLRNIVLHRQKGVLHQLPTRVQGVASFCDGPNPRGNVCPRFVSPTI